MVLVSGLRDAFELLDFEKLELMTLPLSAGSQEFAGKQCIGLPAEHWTYMQCSVL
jgi:hypothetical protein